MVIRIHSLDGAKYSLGSRRTKREKKALSAFLKSSVLPELAGSFTDKWLAEDYPWCFILPLMKGKKKKFYIGSFTIKKQRSADDCLSVLYSVVNQEWILKNVTTNYHFAFWLSRILIITEKNEAGFHSHTTTKEWLSSLVVSCSPFWEALIINERAKFRHKSELLISSCCKDDEKVRSDDGVDIMPWRNWPDCIQTDEYAWIWRQSRYGRTIESKRIFL